MDPLLVSTLLVDEREREREWQREHQSPQEGLIPWGLGSVLGLTEAGALLGNKERGLNTRQCRMPMLKEKPSCYVIDTAALSKIVSR
jgi:hypothetical protein